MLWIALKSWYLWYSEQPLFACGLFVFSCELLSKVDIFDIRNNSCNDALFRFMLVLPKVDIFIFGTTGALETSCIGVVNCSKVDIFDIRNNREWQVRMLEEAVNCSQSWYLDIRTTGFYRPVIASCELLSKVDIFDIRTTLNRFSFTGYSCELLAKVISLIFGTTRNNYFHAGRSCELLSKLIFDIRNNIWTDENEAIVVNCSCYIFDIGTTCGKCIECRKQLWCSKVDIFGWATYARKA